MKNSNPIKNDKNIAITLLKDFGSWAIFADALDIRSQCVYKWNRLPAAQAYVLQELYPEKYKAKNLLKYRWSAKEASEYWRNK